LKKLNETQKHDEMQPEYNFASMKGGVRAKYYAQNRKGTNVVLLQPDVAEAFPTEEAVNEALGGILSTTRAVRRIGGLSDHALQPAAPSGGAEPVWLQSQNPFPRLVRPENLVRPALLRRTRSPSGLQRGKKAIAEPKKSRGGLTASIQRPPRLEVVF